MSEIRNYLGENEYHTADYDKKELRKKGESTIAHINLIIQAISDWKENILYPALNKLLNREDALNYEDILELHKLLKDSRSSIKSIEYVDTKWLATLSPNLDRILNHDLANIGIIGLVYEFIIFRKKVENFLKNQGYVFSSQMHGKISSEEYNNFRVLEDNCDSEIRLFLQDILRYEGDLNAYKFYKSNIETLVGISQAVDHTALDSRGLQNVIQDAILPAKERWQIICDIEFNIDVNLDGVVEINYFYLWSLVYNLVKNSCKAIEGDGQSGNFFKRRYLKEDTKASRVEVVTRSMKDYIVLGVSDNGGGFDITKIIQSFIINVAKATTSDSPQTQKKALRKILEYTGVDNISEILDNPFFVNKLTIEQVLRLALIQNISGYDVSPRIKDEIHGGSGLQLVEYIVNFLNGGIFLLNEYSVRDGKLDSGATAIIVLPKKRLNGKSGVKSYLSQNIVTIHKNLQNQQKLA